MNKPRMWWAGTEQGWMIDTEIALTASETVRATEFTLKIQRDRLRGLPLGPVRDECKETIVALETFKVTQNIVGTGDKVLFDAYKSDSKKVFA